MPEIIIADYRNPEHRQAIIDLLDDYARDPMGGGTGLDEHVKTRLIDEMAARSNIFTLLAFVGGQPVGLANCVEGFSTFAAKPVMNVHDIAVKKDFRGRGIATRLLDMVEAQARRRGCCKLTLEVLTGNVPARAAYERFGFSPYQLDESLGHAEFWHKPIASI